MSTINDVINQKDLDAKHGRTILWTKKISRPIGNVSIQAIFCVNTFSQTYEEKEATREHYVGSDMNKSIHLLKMW